MSESTQQGVPAALRILYVADVARVLGKSPSTTRAYLAALERESEGELVRRRGKKLFITEEALTKVLAGRAAEPSLQRHVAALDRQMRRLTERVRVLEGSHHRREVG